MIRVGTLGYGNLGRGVECAVKHNLDMELKVVFTRRDSTSLQIPMEGVEALSTEDTLSMKNEIDVLIPCGGSVTDFPVQMPQIAEYFNAIDSFDTYANIPQYFGTVDRAARVGGHIGIISVGWDPDMLSLDRLYASAVLPGGRDYTFWGQGVSQDHSDAIRRIHGVKDIRQYTILVEEALTAVKSGSCPELTIRQKHIKECFAAVEEGADLKATEMAIVTMPSYLADYDTTVHFTSEEGLPRNHAGIPHGGSIVHTGKTGWEDGNGHVIEYSPKLDSNPEFTASVITAYARTAYRLNEEGQTGRRTVLDIASSYLSAQEGEELREYLL